MTRASASHEQTARRYQLYTEIYVDRGSLRVTGDVFPVVAGLVKIQTGLTHVSASGYLKQAQEMLPRATSPRRGHGHSGWTPPEELLRE